MQSASGPKATDTRTLRMLRTLSSKGGYSLGLMREIWVKTFSRSRAAAKAKWLTELLDKGSQGDYQAIAYFKRRQSVITQHSNYVARAGGAAQAVQDLKHFYRIKYTPPDVSMPDSAISLFLSRVGSFSSPPPHITETEIKDVLATCKPGKILRR